MSFSLIRHGVRAVLSLLVVTLISGAFSRVSASGNRFPDLLSSSSFFHDYNLAALAPVGKPPAQISGQAGSGSLTLNECIEKALEKSPTYHKSRENYRATMGDLMSAWGLYIPTMSASYGLNQGNQTRPFVDQSGTIRLLGGISKTSSASLSMNFTLFDRGRHYFAMKNARYLRRSRLSDIKGAELELVADVRSAYFNVLKQEKLLMSAKDQAEQRREQLRLAEARFSVGSVTKLDVLQAQIDLQRQDLVILQYENSVITAKLDLDRVVGGGLGQAFALVDEFEIHEPHLDVEQLVGEALEKHPNLESLRLQVKQREGDLWMGRLAYLPSMSTNAGYNRSQDGLVMFPYPNKGRSINFSVRWNILDSFGRFQSNRYTEVNLNNLKYDLATTGLTIERNVRQNYLEVIRLYQQNLTLANNRELASQTLALERERYSLGSSSLYDLRQAQLDYSRAEVEYINSIYDFHTALSELSRNVGRYVAL